MSVKQSIAEEDSTQVLDSAVESKADGASGEEVPSMWLNPGAVVIGEILGLTQSGTVPLVRYRGQPGSSAMFAQTMVDLDALHVGREVALAFIAGDPRRPIVLGLVRAPDQPLPAVIASQVELESDGSRLVVTATDRIVLRCGKSSITLTREGKVLIEGSYVLSRSTGVNRIKGGSVQVN